MATRTYGHKTFEHKFVLILKRTANQNTISDTNFVPIGQFWSMSTKIVLKCFINVCPEFNSG